MGHRRLSYRRFTPVEVLLMTKGNWVELLEARQLLAATASLAGGILTIRGDAGDDFISGSTPSGRVVVNLNGQARAFPADQVRKLRINSGGGNDRVELGGAFWRPVIIRLGADDDYAFGSGRNDRISGGDGDDTVNASAGNDRIFGEAGSDELEGAEGSDTVSGGAGNDLVAGFNGRNDLLGDDGDDTLYTSRLGHGTVTGGAGSDTAWHRGEDANWSFSTTERIRR
jgi:Ca2+-binding RTX toxin-like protein